jgi:hypothetical protein
MDTQKDGEFNPKFRKEVKRDETATMADAGFSWDAGSSGAVGSSQPFCSCCKGGPGRAKCRIL